MEDASSLAGVDVGAEPEADPDVGFDAAAALRAVRDVAGEIGSSRTVPEIVGAIARSFQHHLDGCPSITVGVAEADGPLRLEALEGFDPSTLDRWGSIDREAPVPLTDVLRSGEIMCFATRDEMFDRYPHLRADVEGQAHHSWAAIPMLSETGPCGTVGLAWTRSRAFGEVERLFMLTLAKLGGEALRRASRDVDREETMELLAQASVDDRMEIARDLHDRSVQRLAAASIRLGALRLDATRARRTDLVDQLGEVEADVQAAIRTLRDIIGDLHPPDVSGLGLSQAISEFADWMLRDGPDVAIVDDVGLDMSEPVAGVAYRIAAEALSNVVRHSHATSVVVAISPAPDDAITLSVTDDGVGGDGGDDVVSSASGHLGLRMIRERAEASGGTVSVDGSDGWRVEVVLPTGGAGA